MKDAPMNNAQKRTPAKSDGEDRLEYHTPQLVEFGDLAIHTQSSNNGMPVADGGVQLAKTG